MVRLIKDQEADVLSELDIPVTKCIEEDLWRGDHDPVGDKDPGPKLRAFPLFRFHGPRDEANGDWEAGLNDESLLLAEGDGGCYKPGYLKNVHQDSEKREKWVNLSRFAFGLDLHPKDCDMRLS